MPPAKYKDSYKREPSFYKFWKLEPGMTFEEFNKPWFNQLMNALLVGPIHAKD